MFTLSRKSLLIALFLALVAGILNGQTPIQASENPTSTKLNPNFVLVPDYALFEDGWTAGTCDSYGPYAQSLAHISLKTGVTVNGTILVTLFNGNHNSLNPFSYGLSSGIYQVPFYTWAVFNNPIAYPYSVQFKLSLFDGSVTRWNYYVTLTCSGLNQLSVTAQVPSVIGFSPAVGAVSGASIGRASSGPTRK